MAKVQNYLPAEVNAKFLCPMGRLHTEEFENNKSSLIELNNQLE